MKPVEHTQLADLVQRKPILLLKTAWMGASYIQSIARRAPGAILPRNGTIRSALPVELWLDIVDLLTEDLRSKGLENETSLVQPFCVFYTATGAVLYCAEITERTKCGGLKDGRAVQVYESYLQNPSRTPRTPDDSCPFTLPQAHETTLKAVCIDVALLGSGINVLFDDVTVPDIIAQCERGACEVCVPDQPRWLCPWCLEGPRARSMFLSQRYRFTVDMGFHRFLMFCPLCVGLDESVNSLMQYGDSDRVDLSQDPPSVGPFDDWSKGVLSDLGYEEEKRYSVDP
ncbi:hypothetical protein QIS74_10432 [Colletotrichum tabaci]|uniref:Uncharacterized protein n=1 Tax=Colletotrichum tabaci TaxID=1209068 RepID=A0AAV9T0M3_9PEZI